MKYNGFGIDNMRNEARVAGQTKLNRDKTDKIGYEKKAASAVKKAAAKKDETSSIPGPKVLDGQRDAWGNALGQMSQVRAVDPLTAIAQTAGMGLAGWGQTKATKQKEQGESAFRSKFAQALSGKDPNAFAALMGDPYADESTQRMAMEMWQRQNPTEDQLMQRKVAGLQLQKMEFEIGQMPQSAERDQILFDLQRKKAELDLDLADDPKYGEPVLGKDGRMYRIPVNPTDPVVPVDDFEPHVPDKERYITFKMDDYTFEVDTTDPEQMKWYREQMMQRGGPGSTGAPETNPNGVFKNPKDRTQFETGERQNFEQHQNVKQFRESIASMNAMFASVGDDTGASDQQFVYGFAKIMDPIGTVREGEQRSIMNMDTLTQQMKAEIQNIYSRGGKLSPELKELMYDQARKKMTAIQNEAMAARDQYGEYGRRQGVNPDHYLMSITDLPKEQVGRVKNEDGTYGGNDWVYTPPNAPQTAPPANSQRQGVPSPEVPGTTLPATPQGPAARSLPQDLSAVITPGQWQQILQEAEDDADLAEYLDAVRKDPGKVMRDFPVNPGSGAGGGGW